MDHLLTRRELLRGSMAAAATGVLAACGIRGKSNDPQTSPLGVPIGELSIATRPAYIDVDEKTKKRPTIENFQNRTGINVTYKEVIDDNDPFFGTIREPLSRGDPTGWDIVVVTDWLVERMRRLGYLERLHADRLPLVERYEGEVFKPSGAVRYSVPWQAGLVGIGYNPKLTQRPIISFGDLFDPAFEAKVGMFSDMRDMIHLTLLWMEIDPNQATTKHVQDARDKLITQRRNGIVRDYYENDYTDALANGDVALCLAYSRDIFELQADDPDLEFVVPREGGMLFVDEMAIPKGAEHAADAHEWMDFVYRPEIAAQIAAHVQHVTPVPAARGVLRERAAEATGEEKDNLETVASSPLVFPTAAMRRRLHRHRVLSEDEEREWNELFAPVVEG